MENEEEEGKDKEKRLRDMGVPVSFEYHSAKFLISRIAFTAQFYREMAVFLPRQTAGVDGLTGLFTFPNLNL